MGRALRYDGLLPQAFDTLPDGARSARQANPEELRQAQAAIQARRAAGSPYDIILDGETPGDAPEKARDILKPWVDAGATWWIESRWGLPRTPEGEAEVRKRIQQGPPS
jgi:hypothetical protein